MVFYGESSEAQDAELSGKLVLTNAESMSVKSIRVTLTGLRKVSWYTSNTVRPRIDVSNHIFAGSHLSQWAQIIWISLADDQLGHTPAHSAEAQLLPRDHYAIPRRRFQEQAPQNQRGRT